MNFYRPMGGARSGYVQMRQQQPAIQTEQQSRVIMQRPATGFNHARSGVVGGVTVILVWAFLIFAIIALAKHIFGGRGCCTKRTTTTGTAQNTAAAATEETLK